MWSPVARDTATSPSRSRPRPSGVHSTSAAAPAAPECADVLDRRVEVVQLLAGKQRRREEDVLVGAARPELLWRNRP